MTVHDQNAGLDRLKKRIADAPLGAAAEERGTVIAVADGLATVAGLPGAALNEIVTFANGAQGFILTIEEDRLHAAILDPAETLVAGVAVTRSGRIASVPVGTALLGRVLDPLGRPLDDRPEPACDSSFPIERPAPAIIERDFVAYPVETGVLVVDALFAIGRGQRELVIGERQTGKTALAVDAMAHQRDTGMICIYVAIGQRTAAVRRVIDSLKEHGNFANTIVIVAESAARPGLRWLAPFAATSMAEWFRDRGDQVLIVYDDLTKHAATHRELALLSQQPAGREAYPGDIFYLHSRLLERSGQLSKARGGGSITALPIAEIEAGNLSAYIPTNLISIADGQIVTSAQLFASDQRPAVDIGLSVSRVGGKAQSPALKAVAGRLRLDYVQYLEMKMFSRFGGFGDAAMKARMARGERIAALLAQDRLSPVPTRAQTAILAALDQGVLDDLPVTDLAKLRQQVTTMDGLDTIDPATKPDTVERERLAGLVRQAMDQL